MADAKTTGLSINTDLSGDDVFYNVVGATADGKILAGDMNLGSDGFLWDGKFQVTVATNNITVAIKTRAGNDPSSAEPVTIYIGGTRRRITAALSVTKNAGTNWFGSGGAPFATLEQDYFVYLGWNTTPATDIVDLGFARIPYGRVYSDFSSTTTNEKYLAFANASTPTSTDEWVNIGRFAATLSATASFNWSVPTFTNANLINTPIYNTRRLSWAPAPTGYSAVPTSAVYEYMITNNFLEIFLREGANGTSNGTGVTMTAPFTAAALTNMAWDGFGYGIDNTAALTTTVRLDITSASGTISAYPNGSASATWTNSGGKRIATGYMKYAIG